MTSVIGRADEVVSSIAGAVEEQNAATKAIATNISRAAQDTGRMSGEMFKTADDLQKEAESLRDRVEAFLADMRAA